MRQLLLSVILFMALLIPAASNAQKKIQLQQADRVIIGTDSTNTVDRVKGNVVFIHGSTSIYCDSAYFHKKENSVEAFGNVRLRVAGDVLHGNRLKYNGNTHEADLQPASPKSDAGRQVKRSKKRK